VTISEFNYIESALWFVIAIGLIIKSISIGRTSSLFSIVVIAAISFIAFGISDIIEANTGAWWRPTGLLILKACCIFSFIVCYYKFTKTNKNTDQQE